MPRWSLSLSLHTDRKKKVCLCVSVCVPVRERGGGGREGWPPGTRNLIVRCLIRQPQDSLLAPPGRLINACSGPPCARAALIGMRTCLDSIHRPSCHPLLHPAGLQPFPSRAHLLPTPGTGRQLWPWGRRNVGGGSEGLRCQDAPAVCTQAPCLPAVGESPCFAICDTPQGTGHWSGMFGDCGNSGAGQGMSSSMAKGPEGLQDVWWRRVPKILAVSVAMFMGSERWVT